MKDWEASYVAGIIDGEGSIILTKLHENEHRRPCISIASTDMELLTYVHSLIGGAIISKKNYSPGRHKDSFTLIIKNKVTALSILRQISPYLRVDKKKKRALWIIENYERVTLRNGKYTELSLKQKLDFEEGFFCI